VARRKASLIYLDTHVVAWLYDALLTKLSAPAQTAIERHSTLVSPMVRLELQYLKEIGRLREQPEVVLRDLGQTIGLRESTPNLVTVVDSAMDIQWTRDTFDRLIVAEAIWADARLVTKDTRIREHFASAIW